MVEKSNSSIEQNTESSKKSRKGRLKLKLFKGLAPSGESLRPGYAYLIRSRVRMTELYPLLGEILFSSTVDLSEKNNEGEEQGIDNGDNSPNIIGMFVEDSPDNLVFHLDSPDQYIKKSSNNKTFLDIFLESNVNIKGNKRLPEYAAWMDTYGKFVSGDRKIKMKHLEWWRQSILGSGNPMLMMGFLRRVQREIQQQNKKSQLNLFMLSSLSNLYKNLGLSESSAFLQAILGQIWGEPEPPAEKKDETKQVDSIFFAVLQEGVLDPKEASYIESFFDGIIYVTPCKYKEKFRVVLVTAEVLPELVELEKDFIYLPKWMYEKINKNSNRLGNDWETKELAFIRTLEVDEQKKKPLACEDKDGKSESERSKMPE